MITGKRTLLSVLMLAATIGAAGAASAFETGDYVVVTGTLVKNAAAQFQNCLGKGPNSVHAFGEASCPAGYVALGGSVECQFPGANGEIGGGNLLTSRLAMPTSDGGTFKWLGDCCVSNSGTIASHPGIKVMCAKADVFK